MSQPPSSGPVSTTTLPPPPRPLTQRAILVFWLPLFASWLLMTLEGPIVSAAINRLPDEVVMLAAMGIVIALSVLIESPIINLLATSTALVRDRASYMLVRRFTIHWAIGLTLITVVIAFTPAFDLVVRGWLGVPDEVAVWVEPGMKIMTLWSAAIAWRRFLQGVLIRFGKPRLVAWGTAVRLAASGSTAVGLGLWGAWPGVVIGSCALMAGVLAEAAFASWVVRPLFRPGAPLAEDAPAADETLSYRELFWFHLPLAATSVLVLLVQPLVTFSLARLSFPTLSLAAWPVIFQVTLVARAAAFALPEVIIAKAEPRTHLPPLRRFSLVLAALVTLGMALFLLTPLVDLYVFTVQDMAPAVGRLTRESLIYFLPLPGLAVLISWLRGLLIAAKRTREVNLAMFVNLGVTILVLAVGLSLETPGLLTTALALGLAAGAETAILLWRAWEPATLPTPAPAAPLP